MFKLFTKNPITEMQVLRDRALRIGLTYLEGHAVKGTLSRPMVLNVAKTLNMHAGELIEMIADRRRPKRYAKAMETMRKAQLIGQPEMYDDRQYQ